MIDHNESHRFEQKLSIPPFLLSLSREYCQKIKSLHCVYTQLHIGGNKKRSVMECLNKKKRRTNEQKIATRTNNYRRNLTLDPTPAF
ncbi:hypothetical protein ACTXT7_005256 [Hymenolepis weldensis]